MAPAATASAGLTLLPEIPEVTLMIVPQVLPPSLDLRK